MKRQSKKLSRLLDAHNKIIEWHSENIASLEQSIVACDQQLASTLAALDQMAGMGLNKGPNFPRILQEIRDRRAKLTKTLLATQAEHARVNAIVERLAERKLEVQSNIDELDLEDSIDEWSNAQATFS